MSQRRDVEAARRFDGFNMVAKLIHGEETQMRDTGDEGGGPDATDVDAVRRRLSEIQESKRSRVRWNVSRKTAEMALVALEDFEVPRKKSGKARRRKRFKRLL